MVICGLLQLKNQLAGKLCTSVGPFMVTVLEELCQRKFLQEEGVEVSCGERGECSGVGRQKEAASSLIIEGKNQWQK